MSELTFVICGLDEEQTRSSGIGVQLAFLRPHLPYNSNGQAFRVRYR